MAGAFVFITASNVDYKLVNRLLVDLRGWEYGDDDDDNDDDDDWFTIVQSKYDDDDEGKVKLPDTIDKPGSITEDNFKNEWSGANLDQAITFMRDRVDKALLVVVDDESVRDQTAIVVEKVYHEFAEEDWQKKPYDWSKVRLPWLRTYGMWCNMNIANMGFDEWCEEYVGDNEGWCKANEFATKPLEEKHKKRRDDFLKSLEEKGSV